MSHVITPAQARPRTDARATGRVLVVEDEPDLQTLLATSLGREGFEIDLANSGEQAIRLAQSRRPRLVLLDLMLPGMDGLEVYRQLRAEPETAGIPVVIVSARTEDADVVTGLELGADDYVSKPFSLRVLMARVRAVLRRREEAGSASVEDAKHAQRVHELSIDPDRYEVRVAGELVELTATEFRLLSLLARRPGQVHRREQIIEQIHGQSGVVTDRSVDVLVVGLRRKLGEAGRHIETVRGVGYRLQG